MSDTTRPEVFVIESLGLDDETHERQEGRRIASMLKLSGKAVEYFYIRTAQELKEILKEFSRGEYRYLHLSCHGCQDGLALTFNDLDLQTLGLILRPHVDRRRVFLSACKAATMPLASTLMTNTLCYSVMGPYSNIAFDRAALFWASFYHVMFRENDRAMNHDSVRTQGMATAKLFKVRMNLFTKTEGNIQRHRLR